MNQTLIITNAVLLILIAILAPVPAFTFLALSIYYAIVARHYYRKGGRWGDDYDRTTVAPAYWERQDSREQLADNCFWYRVSLIFTVLFLAAAVVL